MLTKSILSKGKAMLAALGMTVVMGGCSDFLDIDPIHEAGESQQWKTLEDTRSALMGIYGLMRAALVENNTHWACGDLRTGDFTVTEREDLRHIADNQLNLNDKIVDEICDWNRFYRVINAANVFIERAPGIIGQDKAYSEENLRYDVAQARALRAISYFHIARIWGSAPLITVSYDNGSFPLVAQSTQDELIAYVKQELLEIAPVIPFQYGSSNSHYYQKEPDYWQGKLINKVGIYALLSNICATLGNYADVEAYTAYILANTSSIGIKNNYIPISDLVSTIGFFCGSQTKQAPHRFLSFNFIHKNNETTQRGHLEDWTLAYPYVPKRLPEIYVSKDRILQLYNDSKDLRAPIDTVTNLYASEGFFDMNSAFPIFKKVNVVQDGNSKDGDYAVFGSSVSMSRIEDITLLRAEALTLLNKCNDAVASLNAIRMQRGLRMLDFKDDFNEDAVALLNEVFNERRREFIGEGMNWYDLIRRQKLLRDDPEFLELIENGGIYWPISEKVMTENKLIKQNPYWATH